MCLVVASALYDEHDYIRDYDGDGRDDLLWYNFTTGATALWLMNGTATSSAAVIQTNVNWLVWPADGL